MLGLLLLRCCGGSSALAALHLRLLLRHARLPLLRLLAPPLPIPVGLLLLTVEEEIRIVLRHRRGIRLQLRSGAAVAADLKLSVLGQDTSNTGTPSEAKSLRTATVTM